MNVHVSLNHITLPEALMAFLHSGSGVPVEAAKPKQLTAAAELAELLVMRAARIEGETVMVDAPLSTDRAWVNEVTTQLAADRYSVRTWVSRRRGALESQQQEAARRGILVQGRKKFLGLFPYAVSKVDEQARDALLAEMMAPDAAQNERAVLLARIVVKAKLHLWLRLDDSTRSRLAELSTMAPENTPAARTLSAVDLAIGTVIYTTVISE